MTSPVLIRQCWDSWGRASEGGSSPLRNMTIFRVAAFAGVRITAAHLALWSGGNPFNCCRGLGVQVFRVSKAAFAGVRMTAANLAVWRGGYAFNCVSGFEGLDGGGFGKRCSGGCAVKCAGLKGVGFRVSGFGGGVSGTGSSGSKTCETIFAASMCCRPHPTLKSLKSRAGFVPGKTPTIKIQPV